MDERDAVRLKIVLLEAREAGDREKRKRQSQAKPKRPLEDDLFPGVFVGFGIVLVFFVVPILMSPPGGDIHFRWWELLGW